MINNTKLQEWVTKYKDEFPSLWVNEIFKWKAIRVYQDNWNVNADDFVEMLEKSLSATEDLLTSVNYFPRGMILEFSRMEPETVRKMFIDLFDESAELYPRIKAFKESSDDLLSRWEELKEVSNKSHYQAENTITTYLWLRYPDKYYIYKYAEAKKVANEIGSNHPIKKGAYETNIYNQLDLYNEIRDEMKKDSELVEMLRESLTTECYPDPELNTLVVDFGHWMTRIPEETQVKDNDNEKPYWPSLEEYNPGLTKEDWKRYLEEVEYSHHGCMGMLKALMECGGEASCKTLSNIYGGKPTAYVGFAVNIGKRAKKYFDLPPCIDTEVNVERYFPVPFVGKSINGFYTYRIRPELLEALNEMDLSEYSSKYCEGADEVEDEEGRQYWWLNANPKIWSFSDFQNGEVQSYTLLNENGHKRRIYQNFLDAKEGDLIVGYESTPVKQVVALGRVSAAQDGERIYFEKTEGLATPIDYKELKQCPELKDSEYFVNPQGSLFKLTKDEYDFIVDLIREVNPIEQASKVKEYTEKEFLDQVYIDKNKADTLVNVLRNKKNIILQGAPGVGKTFIAKRLAYYMMKEKDDSRIKFVQFHQSYTYEDFVMGYKPEDDTFVLKRGIFYEFCKQAENRPDKEFFFIIDEINRGNLSKIFGELLMLIEKDYRGTEATLAYTGMPFSVPKNLYIIGMMNTADRSLAMIDYALRRRFSFFEIEPGFDSEGFKKYQAGLKDEMFDQVIEKVKELNRAISKDKSLGKGFCIGHSYFCGQEQITEEWLKGVINYDILPMLNEYWFDDPAKVQKWENEFVGILNG